MAWTQKEKDQAIADINAALVQVELVKTNIATGLTSQTVIAAQAALADLGGALIAAAFRAGT